MKVTIIADASVDSTAKVGSYGFWAVSERGRHAGGGVFKGDVSDSHHAEMMAIVNALHMSIALEIAAPEDQVLIQSDCKGAIQVLSRFKVKQRDRAIVERFRKLRDEHRLAIEMRWIKGHSKQDDARYRAQKLVDQESRRAMRRARKLKSVSRREGK